MGKKKATKNPECTSCVKDERSRSVLAIVDPNSCETGCNCSCHPLWNDLLSSYTPFAVPE